MGYTTSSENKPENRIKGLVSVVIPTYNQAEFVAEALKSVLKQTYHHLEVVVADDASSDQTIDIINRYATQDKRIKFLKNTENQGISRNFNKAFDACTGEFVCFLGGDDLMLPNKIERQVALLQKQAEVVLVTHFTELFDNKTGKTLQIHGNQTGEGALPTNPLDWVLATKWGRKKHYTSIVPSSCLARSDYYLHARYDERLRYKHELLFTLDDYMANPNGQWAVIPEVLVRYRVHEQNFSMQTQHQQLVNEESWLLYAIASERYPQLAKRLKNYKDYLLFRQLLHHKKQSSKQQKNLMQQFRTEAGVLKYFYLKIRQLHQRINNLR